MNDDLSGFNDWTVAFTDWKDISISELHGIMTALVCAVVAPNQDQWRRLFGELSLTLPSDEALLLLEQYGEDVAFALKDKDDAYEYAPLLPDDDHDLYERLVALKRWAGGFITGVGVADMRPTDEELAQLRDLAKIAALRVDPEELDEADEGEKEEMYLQLYEFARLLPPSFAVRQKKRVDDLAILKGLAMGRKTAHEAKDEKSSDRAALFVDATQSGDRFS